MDQAFAVQDIATYTWITINPRHVVTVEDNTITLSTGRSIQIADDSLALVNRALGIDAD